MIEKINEFLDKNITKTEKIYLFYSMFLIPLLSLNFNNLTITGVSRFFGILSLISLIFGLYLWYKKTNTLNSLPIYFILSGYLCWYGQVLIRCFGFFKDTMIEIDYFEPIKFYRTCAFLTISFTFLFLGLILFTKKNKDKNDFKTSTIKDKRLKKCMTFIGIAMILVSFIFHYYTLISNLIAVYKNGYASLYANNVQHSGLYNIFSNIDMFFWPGFIILYFANKENRKLFYIILGFVFLDVLLLFLGGSRSTALTLLLVFFWIYSSCYKNIKIQNYIFLILGGLIVGKLFNVIHDFRVMPDKSFSTFCLLFFNSNSSIVLSAIKEFGFNIFSLYHTINLVPATTSFGFGYTYFAAIMAIIPSLLMGGFSFSAKAALPDWLMKTLGMDYGPGYTIVAESYYNFGYLGFIIMFVIGILMGIIFNNKANDDKKIIKTCIMVILFYSNLFIVRDTFLFVFRKTFYLVFIPFLIVYILYKNYDKYLKWLYVFIDKIYNLIDKLNIKPKEINSQKVLLAYDNNYVKMINNRKKYYEDIGYEVDEIDQEFIDNCENKIKCIFLIRKILHNNYCVVESYGSSLSNIVRFANTLNRKMLKIDYYNYDLNYNPNFLSSLVEKYLSKFTNIIIVDNKEKMVKLEEYVLCDIRIEEN